MGTIARSTLTDDDGSGTTGSIWNASELAKIYDNIDTEVKSATNPTVATKSVIDYAFSLNSALTSGLIVTPELKAYKETWTNATISANVLTLDYSLGNHFAVTLNANITTLTLSNLPASGKYGALTILFTADGTLRTITWPAAVKWSGGQAPVMTSTTNHFDRILLETLNGGITIFASVIGQDYF
jgi:hypothetical protein